MEQPTVEIALHRHRQLCGVVAIVDASDAELVAGRKWAVFTPQRSRTQYARCGSVYLHTLIMGMPPETGLEVDHQDGDGLNNRRSNLRWLTHAANVKAAMDRLPFRVGTTRGTGVHVVTKGNRLYFYDRQTRERLTPEQAVDRGVIDALQITSVVKREPLHVHTVRSHGRIYYYDRVTRARLTPEEATERIANPTYRSGVTEAVTDR